MTWSSFRATQQRGNSANGIFFTIDQNDLGHNVEAYLFGGNIPNGYTDLDDDNGDGKDDEAEIVSESPTFPAANTWYYSSVRWSHSYTFLGYWYYDSGSGYIEYDENLSTTSCPIFCDKYDTHCCNVNLGINTFYPSNSEGLQSEPTESAGDSTGAAAAAVIPSGRAYRATRTTDGDVHLHARLDSGLSIYARAARMLAEGVIGQGPADGVVTFEHPLTWDEFLEFEALGASVRDMEFVTTKASDNLRLTFVMSRQGANPNWVGEEAAESNAAVLGIVSANISVPNRAALTRLEASQYVYLIDLSIEDFESNNPGVDDVVQNDVFWTLSGWN